MPFCFLLFTSLQTTVDSADTTVDSAESDVSTSLFFFFFFFVQQWQPQCEPQWPSQLCVDRRTMPHASALGPETSRLAKASVLRQHDERRPEM